MRGDSSTNSDGTGGWAVVSSAFSGCELASSGAACFFENRTVGWATFPERFLTTTLLIAGIVSSGLRMEFGRREPGSGGQPRTGGYRERVWNMQALGEVAGEDLEQAYRVPSGSEGNGEGTRMESVSLDDRLLDPGDGSSPGAAALGYRERDGRGAPRVGGLSSSFRTTKLREIQYGSFAWASLSSQSSWDLKYSK